MLEDEKRLEKITVFKNTRIRVGKSPTATKPCAVARFLSGEPSLARASKPWWLSREEQSDTPLRRLPPIKAQQQVVALIGRHSPKQASEVGQRNQPRHCLLLEDELLRSELFQENSPISKLSGP